MTEMKSDSRHSATRRTVLIAGAANVVVGLTKLTAGILSGSSAMLAEAAHSAADTLNQGFLLASVHQGDRPADRQHQFGYGQERYFWSLLAAFGILIAGGGFSIFEGILALTRTGSESPTIAYVALAIAFVAEGTSFIRAYRQVRGEARSAKRTMRGHMETSPDTTVKTALFEDSAALIGLVFAAVGVGLRQLTGTAAWDGGASIAIGILLIVVAVKLGLGSKDLLIGRAADPRDQDLIRDQIEGMPGVDRLLELQTMHVGPDSLIVAARVDLNDAITADQVEDLAGEIDRALARKLPQDLHVFIDPTQTAKGEWARPMSGTGHEATGSG
jgi:cation diffusion facilitator family transporter